MLPQYFNCNERLEIFLTCFYNILCYVGYINNEKLLFLTLKDQWYIELSVIEMDGSKYIKVAVPEFCTLPSICTRKKCQISNKQ